MSSRYVNYFVEAYPLYSKKVKQIQTRVEEVCKICKIKPPQEYIFSPQMKMYLPPENILPKSKVILTAKNELSFKAKQGETLNIFFLNVVNALDMKSFVQEKYKINKKEIFEVIYHNEKLWIKTAYKMATPTKLIRLNDVEYHNKEAKT